MTISETRVEADLAEVLDEAALRRRLDTAFAGVARKRVVVAVSDAGRRSYAAIGGGGDAADEADEAERQAVPTGCVTKLFVAALIADEISSGTFGSDDEAARLLDMSRGSVLTGVTIRHLLEHTHGLDDSAITAAPATADGSIDAAALLARLDGHRLAEPGAYYSYSNVGAWLLAAVLERVHGRPFESLLHERVLEALRFRDLRSVPCSGPGNRICAATGGALALSVRDLLTFLEARAAVWRTESVTPLPGWSVLEKGVCLGWKYHGEGWFGHQSIASRVSLMARIEPRRRIALVVASERHPAPVVAAKLFARLLPELGRLELPKRLPPWQAAALDLHAYRGRYGCAAERWTVSIEDDAPSLRLSTASFTTPLEPAEGELFFTRIAGPGRLAFVQFVERAASSFRYVWDGRRLLRRWEAPARPAADRP